MNDKPLRVLFFDSANRRVKDWFMEFSRSVKDLPIHPLFLSEFEPSQKIENAEFINVGDVPVTQSIEKLEEIYRTSLHRAMVMERSYFDYTSFSRTEKYSELSVEGIREKVTPLLNAYDFVIRERADLVIAGMADTLRVGLGAQVARHYKKPFYRAFVWYWWKDGLLLVDREDQTSTRVDAAYEDCMAHPEKVDVNQIRPIFESKKVSFQVADNDTVPAKEISDSEYWKRREKLEPRSRWNWYCRKIVRRVSAFLIQVAGGRRTDPGKGPFVLFPMHVMPEAALLGSDPEWADQFSLIKNISLSLPFGVRLCVKEHPAQRLGAGIHYDFYRRLKTIPNVVVVRKEIDIKKLMTRAECLAVAVINGTSGLEAAILRKPVFVFGKAIYGKADCFIRPRNFCEFSQQLLEIRRGEFKFNETALGAILQALNDCVVREKADFSQPKTFFGMWQQNIPIYRSFLIEQLKLMKSDSLRNPPS